MNISTDLVKNKKFNCPINSSLQNCSQEYRVLATLRYLYPGRFDTMVKAESPDLQDCKNNIGIEVTVGVQERDMKANRIFSELCQESKGQEKCKRIIESCGYAVLPLKDETFAIYTSGTSDGERDVFQKSIRRKEKKIQQYRTKFKKIGLAILLPEIPTSDAEDHFSKWISELTVDIENQFDFFFVISHRFCIYYSAQGKISEKKAITKDESRFLSTIGRMTAEGEISLTDVEWL